MKYKVLALFGPSGSGKDTIQKWYASNTDVNEIISATTRPARDYEVDGEDYYFLTDFEFTDKVLNGEMLEATSFREWWYGTPITSLKEDKINVGVFNITGIELLLQDERIEILPVLVKASDKTRLYRCLDRETNPDVHEICRRYLKDEEDFYDIPFTYDVYNNDADYYEFNIIELKELLDKIKED